MKIEIGNQAPNFELYNTNKIPIKLSDQKNKSVLLLFFPFAFTSTCTKELCAIRDDISIYSDLDVEVFGISVDSPHCLKRFKEEQKLNFQLLSDFNKTVSDLYGCIYSEFGMQMRGVSKRAAFLIGANGIVQYAEVLENASEVPDFEKIKIAVKTNRNN